MTHRQTIFLAILLVTSGCARAESASLAAVTVDTLPGGIISVSAEGPTAWTDTSGWRLVEDGALEGDVGMPGEFVDPQDLAVDERGWVYVADSKPASIKVFDDKGKFVRSFGRDGQGPGEWRAGFIAVRRGQVLVHDPQSSRASLFDTSGTYKRTFPGTCCYWMRPYLDEQSRVVLPSPNLAGSDAWRTFFRYDTLGQSLDTLLVPSMPVSPSWDLRQGDRMMMSTSVPFTPGAVAAFTPAGSLIFGWSGDYRLALMEDGDTARVFGRAWTAEPVADSRRDEEYDRAIAGFTKSLSMEDAAIRQQFEKSKIPSSMPAFEGVSVDGLGNVWVHVFEDSARTRFDVFDPAGAYLGPVEVATALTSYSSAWGRDMLYVLAESEDGFPQVRRYRLVKGR